MPSLVRANPRGACLLRLPGVRLLVAMASAADGLDSYIAKVAAVAYR